jgi:hypothetical protein
MMFDTDRFGGVAYTGRDMTDLVSTVDFLKRTRDGMDDMPAIEDSIIPDFGNKAEEAIMWRTGPAASRAAATARNRDLRNGDIRKPARPVGETALA